MNTNATGASARQSGFSAHAVPRNSPAATRTAAHACASVNRPDGSSRARVRGFFASRSRSAIRLKPSATQRAHVNASTTSASSRHVTGCSRDATSKPSSANGSANRVWGSLTKLTYRTRRLPPAKVWPSRRTSELDAKLPPHRVHLLLRLWIHHDPVRPLAREPFFLPFASGVDAHLRAEGEGDRKSTRLNSSHSQISYAVFCLKKKKKPGRILHRKQISRFRGPPSASRAIGLTTG